jgi:hypothetical protein
LRTTTRERRAGTRSSTTLGSRPSARTSTSRSEEGAELIGPHDEVASGQEELYVVVTGEATFDLDEEPASAPAVTVVAVPDPTVRRRAVAAAAGTVVLAVGGKPLENFVSSWRPQWFEHVPRASGA